MIKLIYHDDSWNYFKKSNWFTVDGGKGVHIERIIYIEKTNEPSEYFIDCSPENFDISVNGIYKGMINWYEY